MSEHAPNTDPRLQAHPRVTLAGWTCPRCGTRQTLDPREDVKRLVDTLPPPVGDRSPTRGRQAASVQTLELIAKRCRQTDCGTVAVTAALGSITQQESRLRTPVQRARTRSRPAGQATFHLTPPEGRPVLPPSAPDAIRRDVTEARIIAEASPRAAAALYRRALRAILNEAHLDADAELRATALGPDDPLADIDAEALTHLSRLVDRLATLCWVDG